MYSSNPNDTIVALSTAPGVGAIAMIRISGSDTFAITDQVFSKKVSEKPSHTAHFGTIKDDKNRIIDEVVVVTFKNPHSFTGEDVVEISCHGSVYIQQEIIQLVIAKGARMAEPGEFSMRAYLNGKLDLSQAEAISDVITSTSEAAHKMAMNQMRGGFSAEISTLREQLIHFASLIELELDFAEEDVEFADRSQLHQLLAKIDMYLVDLIHSFKLGNAIKNGMPVAILGAPNAGKSTLLNALLNEEKAIVSSIAGTTRDVIEDEMVIKGVSFRFIDTAGLRITNDEIESKGIERSYVQANKADVILYLIDLKNNNDINAIQQEIEAFTKVLDTDASLIILLNKIDEVEGFNAAQIQENYQTILISAKEKENIDDVKNQLYQMAVSGKQKEGVVVSNIRHYNALNSAKLALDDVVNGLQLDIPSDLIAMDIRQCLHHLGTITGEISTDDLLDNIFSKFCIGK